MTLSFPYGYLSWKSYPLEALKTAKLHKKCKLVCLSLYITQFLTLKNAGLNDPERPKKVYRSKKSHEIVLKLCNLEIKQTQ